MADVFISYKREERARCIQIYEKLTRLEFKVWFDAKLEVGVPFPDEIDFEARSATSILVLWSPLSVQSDWVKKEAAIGVDQKKLAPAFIESTDLPVMFRLENAADLTDFNGEDDHKDWIRLIERLGSLTDRKGLGQFTRILAKGDATEAAAWAVENYADPLSHKAVAIVSEILAERTAEFIKNLTQGELAGEVEAETETIASADSDEERYWLAICDSEDYRDFSDFLKRHPHGDRANEAMKKYKSLLAYSRTEE